MQITHNNNNKLFLNTRRGWKEKQNTQVKIKQWKNFKSHHWRNRTLDEILDYLHSNRLLCFHASGAAVAEMKAFWVITHCTDIDDWHLIMYVCVLSQVSQIWYRNRCSDKCRCLFHRYTHSCKPQDRCSWSILQKDCPCTRWDRWTLHGSSNRPCCKPDRSSCMRRRYRRSWLSGHSDIHG